MSAQDEIARMRESWAEAEGAAPITVSQHLGGPLVVGRVVDHQMMEAVVKYWDHASSEMLPALIGPDIADITREIARDA